MIWQFFDLALKSLNTSALAGKNGTVNLKTEFTKSS